MSEFCVCNECGSVADLSQLNEMCDCGGYYLDTSCIQIQEYEMRFMAG